MNTSKQVVAMMGLMMLLVVSLFLYLLNEGNRQGAALEEVTERNAERGARLFVQNCRSCHGLGGLGPEDEPAGFGAKLNSPAFLVFSDASDHVYVFDAGRDEIVRRDVSDLEPTSAGVAAGIRGFLADTIACGRTNTFMPSWSERFGGPLSDTQINHLVTMITNARWDLVEEIGHEVDEESGLTAAEIIVSDLSALSITRSNCGQYTGDQAQNFRARDPFAPPGAATAAPTATPAAATTAAPAGGAVVEVSLTEFSLTPAVDAAAAADGITFQVSNDGVVTHEFVVIRSDAAPDALPLAAGVVDESQVEVMGRIDQWPGEGETREATFSLTPGRYLLICNLVTHYQLGMTAAFSVE